MKLRWTPGGAAHTWQHKMLAPFLVGGAILLYPSGQSLLQATPIEPSSCHTHGAKSCLAASPTPTPVSTPTPTPTPTPTSTSTSTPTLTPTPTSTSNPTLTPTPKSTSTPTLTPTPTPTPTPGSLLWTGDFESGNLSGWTNQSCLGPSPPAGVTIVTSPVRTGHYAAKFTVADNSTKANCPQVPTSNPRAQLVSPGLFNPGDDRYIAISTFFPSGFPTITDWFQVAEIYGPPWAGSPSMGLIMVGNRLAFNTGMARLGSIWTSPTDIAKGTGWEDIVLHVKFSTDPSVGFVELWRNGVQQTLSNGSKRFYYATLISGVNWDGSSPNHLYFNQYRSAATPMGTVTLYHDAARVGTSYASVAP